MLRECKYLHKRTLTTSYVNIPQHASTYAAVWSGWKRLNNRALAADEWTVWVSESVCVCVWACVRQLQWTHVALLPPPSWHTSYNICAPPGDFSFLFLFSPVCVLGMLVDSEIDLSTRNGNTWLINRKWCLSTDVIITSTPVLSTRSLSTESTHQHGW